jgi:hypothetical protein
MYVSIKIRVRVTSVTVVGDAEVQDQRHRSLHFRKVSRLLNDPTMLTSVFNDLYRFHFVCCAEKVSELINHPLVNPLESEWVVQKKN